MNDGSSLAKSGQVQGHYDLGIKWVGWEELTFRGLENMMRNSEIIL